MQDARQDAVTPGLPEMLEALMYLGKYYTEHKRYDQASPYVQKLMQIATGQARDEAHRMMQEMNQHHFK